MTREDIYKIVEEEGVEFIRLQFTDMFGTLKNISITVGQLDKALDNQFMFDGSSVEGFVGIEDSDLYLHPDIDTFEIFPWRPQQGKVARFICNVCHADATPFDGDPRYVLKKAVHMAKESGYHFQICAECEFFLFETDEEGNPTTKTREKASYFDVGPLDTSENVRRDIVLNLEEMGYGIQASHHEIAKSQHEIDFMYDHPLRVADSIMTFRMAVKTLAKKHGLHATFMPKPLQDENGSGMHLKFILEDEVGKDLFVGEKSGVSPLCESFIAGLLSHMEEITLLNNPLVNSYKRFIKGFDAPIYLAWSSNSNRSTLIRIPGSFDKVSIELRSPDASANPYLAIAGCIFAALDGIERGLDPEKSINVDMYTLSEREIKKYKLKQLPNTLEAAISHFAQSGFIKERLGNHIYTRYLEAKKKEWREFSQAITDWEKIRYLNH